MQEFIQDNIKDSYKDSKESREKFMSPKDSAQFGVVTLLSLLVAIVLSFLSFITFSNIMLFLAVTELVAIKDTLRKGLTPQD